MKKAILTATMLGLAAGAAHAQTPGPLTNGSFEVLNPFSGSGEPDGWHNVPITWARRRTVGDGLTPALFAVGTPGQITPRTGSAVIELTNHGGFGGFTGFTTDTVNFGAPGFPFYDPLVDFSAGDIIVRGWYMIPPGQSMSDAGYIKLNLKVGNQDVAGIENFDPAPGSGSISGATNGEWRELVVRFRRSDFRGQYFCNVVGSTGNCGCACVPASPLPNHLKITPARFVADGTPTTGTLFFDDLSFEQLPYCPADLDDGSGNGDADGGVTIDDLLFFLAMLDLGDTRADLDDGTGTGTPDGGVTIDDLLFFLARFDAGC